MWFKYYVIHRVYSALLFSKLVGCLQTEITEDDSEQVSSNDRLLSLSNLFPLQDEYREPVETPEQKLRNIVIRLGDIPVSMLSSHNPGVIYMVTPCIGF